MLELIEIKEIRVIGRKRKEADKIKRLREFDEDQKDTTQCEVFTA